MKINGMRHIYINEQKQLIYELLINNKIKGIYINGVKIIYTNVEVNLLEQNIRYRLFLGDFEIATFSFNKIEDVREVGFKNGK